MHELGSVLKEDERAWQDLDEAEQAEDLYGGTLLGPFVDPSSGIGNVYHFDLEANEFVWEVAEGKRVLSLPDIESLVQQAEEQVRSVLGNSISASALLQASASEGTYTSGEESEGAVGVTRGRSFMLGTGGPSWRTALQQNPNTQRLPWKVLYWTTRGLQLGWFLLFV
ncbi:unnamed protein product, partial [Polarella glacialis]